MTIMVNLVELMAKQKEIIIIMKINLMKILNYVKVLVRRIKGFRIIKEKRVRGMMMDRV